MIRLCASRLASRSLDDVLFLELSPHVGHLDRAELPEDVTATGPDALRAVGYREVGLVVAVTRDMWFAWFGSWGFGYR